LRTEETTAQVSWSNIRFVPKGYVVELHVEGDERLKPATRLRNFDSPPAWLCGGAVFPKRKCIPQFGFYSQTQKGRKRESSSPDRICGLVFLPPSVDVMSGQPSDRSTTSGTMESSGTTPSTPAPNPAASSFFRRATVIKATSNVSKSAFEGFSSLQQQPVSTGSTGKPSTKAVSTKPGPKPVAENAPGTAETPGDASTHVKNDETLIEPARKRRKLDDSMVQVRSRFSPFANDSNLSDFT
jgi:hypothetical protein